ncbi:MAG: response regulator [Magnetococcales bacterium]|nr:response regulator [Magnetococcales bacterium]
MPAVTIRLLLVEDEETDATVFRRHLMRGMTDRPHHLTCAPTYSIALECLRSQSFDLCFFDYRLGANTGLELLQEMRGSGIETPIVFLTGCGDEEIAVTLMKFGAADYLVKEHLSPEVLSRSLHYALELAQSERRRRAAEAALVEKSLHMDNVLRSATDLAIITADLDLIVQYFNPMAATLLGITQEETLGHDVREFHKRFAVDEQHWMQAIQNVRAQAEHRFEMQVEKRDGIHFLEGRVSGVLDQRHQLAGYCLTVRDVTERRRLLLELEQAVQKADSANHAKSAFLAAMSHEIRTPMNTIIGVTDLLGTSTLDAETMHHVQLLKRAGDSLLALINDILDISKIEAGQLHLENATFDFPDLVQGTLEILGLRAKTKGIDWSVTMDETIPRFVRGDPDRLRQILLNLLGNALKFTEKGAVRLEISRGEGEWTRLTVTDTGVGIPEDKLDDIFQPFVQSDASTTRRFGGTGLGLSICRHLSEKMGGRIQVESILGKGSSFSVFIPLPEMEEPSIPKPSYWDVTTEIVQPERSLSILCADDAQENLILIDAFLDQTEHRLSLATNGLECLEKFKKGGCDLVLMDIQMPVMDGLEATRSIRAWEQEMGWKPTIIVALTGHATRCMVEKAQEVGCDLHVSKPVRRNRLLEVISHVAAKRSLLSS